MHISYRKLRKFIYLIFFIVLIVFSGIKLTKMIFPVTYRDYVYKYSSEFNIDHNLIFAMIKTESNFLRNAISNKNAKGLMQITDNTGAEAASKLKMTDFKPEDLFDAEKNIKIGCWYLSWLINYFEGNIDLAIAAYNGGIGNVNLWLKDKNLSASGEKLDKIPFKETNNFVKRVKGYYKIYQILYD